VTGPGPDRGDDGGDGGDDLVAVFRTADLSLLAVVKSALTGADIPFAAAKGMGGLDLAQVNAIQLDGDTAIVGHTLVLHDDKKGKPGKALACGPIAGGGD